MKHEYFLHIIGADDLTKNKIFSCMVISTSMADAISQITNGKVINIVKGNQVHSKTIEGVYDITYVCDIGDEMNLSIIIDNKHESRYIISGKL